PSGAGSSFIVRVTDKVGATATKPLSITIAGAPVITTTSLPAGTVNAIYNQTVVVSGGTFPYNWAVTAGSLPNGLTMTAGTGLINGTPTVSGTFNFTVRVTDNANASAFQPLSIIVVPALQITT